MRVDSLIPSIDDVLHGMIKRDTLEKCLIDLLSMSDLEFEHPSTVHEISENILSIDEMKILL